MTCATCGYTGGCPPSHWIDNRGDAETLWAKTHPPCCGPQDGRKCNGWIGGGVKVRCGCACHADEGQAVVGPPEFVTRPVDSPVLCILCGKEALGFAYADGRLCHHEERDCYHRWTVYGQRPNQGGPAFGVGLEGLAVVEVKRG